MQQSVPSNGPTTPIDAAPFYATVAEVLHSRCADAVQRFAESAGAATQAWMGSARARTPVELWHDTATYWCDLGQRSLLFWDTLRQRGNNWCAHEKAGKPPVLAFDWEMVADARTFEHPVNYALVRIVPPQGVTTDPDKRPYIVIDPRAGHGPGIGGFKEASQVGLALGAGHPVYAVIFFPEPMDGQTLADVARAETDFVRMVRERHPTRGKPVIIGNCQGGWAAMLVGALDPEGSGPIVVNGAPMSYWAGNDAENPMRYAGGILGGTWPALFASDLGGGIFDGAYLVDNFEYLNPANTFFGKYYNLYANIDTEPRRFLEFERWWGGFFLMNREEIRWIVDNLFVGNKLAAGQAEWGEGHTFDLRAIRSPIIVFASLGDNITPPQQAFNWVADLYPTTEDLKANGQVIVGLMHKSVGHLGIFVSGSVAKREHARIVDLLEYIEHLPPGLYGMMIEETVVDGVTHYDATLTERRVEELQAFQKYGRRDEIPFETVARVSEVNTALYESFVHPLLAAAVPPDLARGARALHPLRMQRWAVSDLNPCLAPLGGLASLAAAHRTARDDTGPSVGAERWLATMTTSSLDLYRDLRDAAVENVFYNTYGSLGTALPERAAPAPAVPREARRAPAVRQALAHIEEGGFTDAAVRAALLAAKLGGRPRRLSTMKQMRTLVGADVGLLDMPADAARAIVQEQSHIVDYEPDRALRTLPKLLHTPAERQRILDILDRLVSQIEINTEQAAWLHELKSLLAPDVEVSPVVGAWPPPARKGHVRRGRR